MPLRSDSFVVAGVYWPSKPFRESYDTGADGTRGLHDDSRAMAEVKAQLEDLKKHDATPGQRRKLAKAIKLLPTLDANTKAQDEFVELVLSLLEHSALDKTEGMPQLRQRSGSELLARLSDPTGETAPGGSAACSAALRAASGSS